MNKLLFREIKKVFFTIYGLQKLSFSFPKQTFGLSDRILTIEMQMVNKGVQHICANANAIPNNCYRIYLFTIPTSYTFLQIIITIYLGIYMIS